MTTCERSVNHSKILIVVAHPDDETLGSGATIRKFADEGATSSEAKARTHRPTDGELNDYFEKATRILGVDSLLEKRRLLIYRSSNALIANLDMSKLRRTKRSSTYDGVDVNS